jgi:predicted RNA-binding protein with PIN domain
MNLIGARPDGWWRDRPAAMRSLVARLDGLARATGEEVTVIFDGRAMEIAAARVEVAFAARRGPDAADEEIARRVACDPAPGDLCVVTSDRALAARVRAAGAEVRGSGGFRRLLDAHHTTSTP